MLRCWSCEARFVPKMVWKNAIIRGRSETAGGPYRLYRCPLCMKLSRIESSRRGRLFASPDRDFGILDYLLGWIDAPEASDFLRIAQWHQVHADRRRQFFLRDGDTRYARGRWYERLRAGIHRLFGRAAEPRFSEAADSEPPPNRESKPPEPPPQVPLPHPYRILGVSRDATPSEIRAAFRRLAKKWHPDKQVGSDPEQLELAARRLAELVDAYNDLTGS
ncbi:MAG: J domain-containing protein [Planctomycetota bacterium]